MLWFWTMEFKPSIHSNNPDKPFLGYVYTQLLMSLNEASKGGHYETYIELVEQLALVLHPKKHEDYYKKEKEIQTKYDILMRELPTDRNGNIDESIKLDIMYQRAKERFALLMVLIEDATIGRTFVEEIGFDDEDVQVDVEPTDTTK